MDTSSFGDKMIPACLKTELPLSFGLQFEDYESDSKIDFQSIKDLINETAALEQKTISYVDQNAHDHEYKVTVKDMVKAGKALRFVLNLVSKYVQ